MSPGKKNPYLKTNVVVPGDKFGRLTVLEAGAGAITKVLCQCSCGIKKRINIRTMRKGESKSCGCGRTTADLSRTSVNVPKPYRAQWKQYRGNGSKKHAWKLTIDEFVNLVSTPCFYCGAEPRSGIDRVDTTGDYEISNCVPCCFTCNGMKSNRDAEQFLQHVTRIHEYNSRYN